MDGPADPPSTSARFGRYRLLERIGAGGMAVVYRAVVDGPEGFSRSLVIKRVRPDLSREPEFAQMLVAEARLSAKLRHPHIVQVHEFGKIDGEYYLAMEQVDGIDLSTLLKHCASVDRLLPVGAVAFLVSQLAAALAYAHDFRDDDGRPLQIVHRDVTPSNIMITTGGTVKLLDFGIAKATSLLRSEETRTGTLKGKLSYLSPEQVDSLPVDRRSDIFALGVVMHEALTAKRLFRGKDDLETINLVRQARVAAPSTLREDVGPEVDAVVLRMLARDPDARFQHCDEIVSALAEITHRLRGDERGVRSFVTELGPIVRPMEPGGPANPGAPQSGTVTQSSGEIGTPVLERGRSSWTRRTLALPLAVVLAIGVAFFARSWRDPPPAPSVPQATPGPPPPRATPEPGSPVPALSRSLAEAPTPPTAKAQVHVHIEARPTAEVFVDGRPIGHTPLDVDLPKAAGKRLILIRAGKQVIRRSVRADRDVSLSLSLSGTKHSSHPAEEDELRNPFAR